MLLASAPLWEWSLLSSRPTSRAHDRSLHQGDPTRRTKLTDHLPRIHYHCLNPVAHSSSIHPPMHQKMYACLTYKVLLSAVYIEHTPYGPEDMANCQPLDCQSTMNTWMINQCPIYRTSEVGWTSNIPHGRDQSADTRRSTYKLYENMISKSITHSFRYNAMPCLVLIRATGTQWQALYYLQHVSVQPELYNWWQTFWSEWRTDNPRYQAAVSQEHDTGHQPILRLPWHNAKYFTYADGDQKVWSQNKGESKVREVISPNCFTIVH